MASDPKPRPAPAARTTVGLAPATKAGMFGKADSVDTCSDQPYRVIGKSHVALTGITKVNQPD